MGDGLAGGSVEITARMDEIIGKPPRIEPLAVEEISEEAMDLIVMLNASLGFVPLSIIPESFRTMLRHPDLFRCQMETGTALFTGTLGGRERELAILRVGWLCGAPYQWGEHVDLARLYDITPEEIERVVEGSSAAGWDAHEAAILRAVEELLDDSMIGDDTWNALARTWSEQQLIEFMALVGAYVTTAFQQNALRMRLQDTNPGLGAR